MCPLSQVTTDVNGLDFRPRISKAVIIFAWLLQPSLWQRPRTKNTHPRNPLGLADSKTSRSSSQHACDGPRRHVERVLVYVPGGAIRPAQSTVCPWSHHNVPGEEHGPRQGDARRRDLNKPWRLHLLPHHCGLGGGLKLSFRNDYEWRIWPHRTTEGGEDALGLCRRCGVPGEPVSLDAQGGASVRPQWVAGIRECACPRRMHQSAGAERQAAIQTDGRSSRAGW